MSQFDTTRSQIAVSLVFELPGPHTILTFPPRPPARLSAVYPGVVHGMKSNRTAFAMIIMLIHEKYSVNGSVSIRLIGLVLGECLAYDLSMRDTDFR